MILQTMISHISQTIKPKEEIKMAKKEIEYAESDGQEP